MLLLAFKLYFLSLKAATFSIIFIIYISFISIFVVFRRNSYQGLKIPDFSCVIFYKYIPLDYKYSMVLLVNVKKRKQSVKL